MRWQDLNSGVYSGVFFALLISSSVLAERQVVQLNTEQVVVQATDPISEEARSPLLGDYSDDVFKLCCEAAGGTYENIGVGSCFHGDGTAYPEEVEDVVNACVKLITDIIKRTPRSIGR